MRPRPPTSTLFPYTTLFRSGGIELHEIPVQNGRDVGEPQRRARVTAVCLLHGIERQEADTVRHLADRKSTRLNSSHVEISYAVFCLKKKKRVTSYPRRCFAA